MAQRILIIGAGLGGMAATLALLQRGLHVAVYEDAPALGDVGAGISIQVNARRVLDALGLVPALTPELVLANGTARRHHVTGEVLSQLMFDDSLVDNRTWFLHRADLHQAFVDAVNAIDPSVIHLGKRLTGFDQDEDGVTAHFADGSTARGEVLIGCDGLRSATREALFGPENPRFSGVVAWRGLVPMDRLPQGLVTPDSCRWIGPDWRILCYPVRHRTLMNYVAAVGHQTWQVESWKEPSEVSEVLNAFGDGDPTIERVLRETPPDLCFKWAIFDRDPLPRWTVDRVTLLGDAAHAMVPFLGQGAGMAIEDGLVLARCLAEDPDRTSALARYERNRKPRSQAVQLEAREVGRWPFKYEVENLPTDPGSNARDRAALEAYDAATVPLP